MRFSVLPAILSACLAFTGCTSGSPDRLVAGIPSAETTSSVTRSPGPVPAASIGETTPVQPDPPQEVLAWAGPVPQPEAFAPVAVTAGMPVPMERPLAELAPAEPEIMATPGPRRKIYSHKFRDAKPINFGKVSPRKYAVHGVDVSRWQGEIDWARLRTQGANFAYIKATDGGDHLDPMFKTNWRRAKEAGLKRGAYHFFYWCRTAGEQADWFIRNVPRDPDALPPVIDVEYNGESSCKRRVSRANVLEKMQVFMDKLERHYGQRPVIYTAPDFYRDNLRGEFPNHPFWLRAVAAHPSKVYPGRKWIFWQYSGSGLSHGVKGKIDLNVFHGSEQDWHAWSSPRSS
ncbi:glycosyl hydrolase [Rhizobiaceae bacterium n13]|uniref:Glycosyl hydrolase n=1 Tax=Ferirhizobium litorale TaxID=2927786 RepID=A0AAE3QGH5_9HYPH|nr:GH25 family lysozyme [Fererhizobium litorale]MDI7864489.1 glycosyl hydrolase [Fererhizobium litorale]MDI7924760.1 glycosyl hydrolase [Fererhizobium litorale]